MSTDTAPAQVATIDLEDAPVVDRVVQPPVRRSPAPTPTPPKAAAKAEITSGGVEHWIVPLVVLIVGMFMSVLDTSIVNVAISAIQTDFGGSTADVAWISTAYSLVLGVVVPASAWLGDRVGLSRVYMVSLAAFALGSALCGLAWNLDSLIAFRVIQAIPGGLLPAVCLTMVYRLVPPAKIGAAMGMYGLGIIVAPAIG
ncbi:MAG: MFS transporter, partial [Janthinobacterium lividum]